MEKTFTIVCLALLMLAACQEQTFEDRDKEPVADLVPLGIGTATTSMTKALVAPGVQTTNGMQVALFATGDNYYKEDASTGNNSATFTYTTGTGWTTPDNIYLTAAPATLYGYYPATAALTKDATTPKVAVSVTESGAIATPIPDNASGVWRAAVGSEQDVNGNTIVGGTSAWFAKAPADPSLHAFAATPDEVDYLAFIPASGKGRLTNNGKANGGVATGDNLGANPGPTLANLSLEHGMAMVSFRLYNTGTYQGAADWTKLVLKNAAGKSVLSKGTAPTMSLVDAGMTPGVFAAATITRTIASKAYHIPRIDAKGSASASVVTTAKEAQAAAPKISFLVLPIAGFAAGDMQVVLTLDGVDYPPISIPAAPVSAWKRGENYMYTINMGGTGLSITDVTVEGWTDIDGGNVPMN